MNKPIEHLANRKDERIFRWRKNEKLAWNDRIYSTALFFFRYCQSLYGFHLYGDEKLRWLRCLHVSILYNAIWISAIQLKLFKTLEEMIYFLLCERDFKFFIFLCLTKSRFVDQKFLTFEIHGNAKRKNRLINFVE